MKNGCNSTTVARRAVLRRVRQLIVAFSLCFLATGTAVMAQNLADFRRAASGDGSKAIPFQDLRGKAVSLASEIGRSNVASGSWRYSTYERQKDSLLKEKAAKQKAITAQNKGIEELKARHGNVNVLTQRGRLKELRNDLIDINNDIAKMNDKLEDGAEAWKRLWNAHGGLRKVFGDALGEVNLAKSNPKKYLGSSATDEDIKKLERYLDAIEVEIRAGERFHHYQEEGTKETEQKFRNLINKTKY